MNNCIYKISSLVNGRIYIGSCTNSIKRKSLHFRHLVQKRHHNIKLQRHANKYGVNDLVFEILEADLQRDCLIIREQFYIDKLNPFFNICRIAGSAIGRKHSVATKNKISNSLKGKKYTDERKKNMSNGRKGVRPKPFTEQHRKNMSLAMKGKAKKPMTQERKNKLSEIWKKKKSKEFFI